MIIGDSKGDDRLARARKYRVQLQIINARIQKAASFAEVMPEVHPDMLAMLGAERVTVYKCARNGRDIISTFKSGDENSENVVEIRVPLSTSSIAGYVALSQVSVCLRDVYNDAELQAVHPKLHFDQRFDQKTGFVTKSMVVVPIVLQNVLLGVLQFINKLDGTEFGADDVFAAEGLAKVISEKFGDEFELTKGPYDYLVRRKLISEQQLEEFQVREKVEKVPIIRSLVEDGKLSVQDIGTSMEHYYQIPFMMFDPELQLNSEWRECLNYIYLKKQGWVPIGGSRRENHAVILIDDPSDYGRIMEMERVLAVSSLAFKIGLKEDIHRYINLLFEKGSPGVAGGGLDDLVGKLNAADDVEVEEKVEEDDEVEQANDHEIVQLVNQIIAEAYNANASDIHIEPGKERTPATVRIRVDGICRKLSTIPAARLREVIARIKIMSGMDMAQKRKPQDGKCKLKIRGNMVELRVATLPTVHGESAVLRILAAGGAMPIEKLNLSERNFKYLKETIKNPYGLFLVVGPTGSGKTTTLHAILDHINTPDRKIWTAEDPVEITQPGLQQVQVSRAAGFTFADAMRAFLRADPDVILIGEMRDQETSHIGVEASLTGHLVLSTLHTNSAPETITRLLDLGLDPISFSDALLGVLAQRLMRTLCPKCKEPYKPEQKELDYLIHNYGEANIHEVAADFSNIELYKAVGCPYCGDSGYRGRTGIHELLVASDEIRKCIYQNATIADIRDLAIKEGMRTILQDGIAKVFSGMSDVTQLHRVAVK